MEEETLLKKWLNGNLTDDEMKLFRQFEKYPLYQEILDSSANFKASYFSAAANFDTFNEQYQSLKKPVRKFYWMQPMLRIASVLVIVFAIYFTFFFDNTIHVQTFASQKTLFELPDKSKVTLNALSSITYKKRGWDNNRTLELHGEAYFEVAKGKKFDVMTKDGLVSVVGTKFNVKQRDNYFEVKCYEGIVKVKSDTIERELFKGDTFQIIHGVFKTNGLLPEVPQWTNNSSNFKSIPFAEVIAELERQYDIKVSLKNVDAKRIFTGGFLHDNLESALISITQPMNLKYLLSTANQIIVYAEKN